MTNFDTEIFRTLFLSDSELYWTPLKFVPLAHIVIVVEGTQLCTRNYLNLPAFKSGGVMS